MAFVIVKRINTGYRGRADSRGDAGRSCAWGKSWLLPGCPWGVSDVLSVVCCATPPWPQHQPSSEHLLAALGSALGARAPPPGTWQVGGGSPSHPEGRLELSVGLPRSLFSVFFFQRGTVIRHAGDFCQCQHGDRGACVERSASGRGSGEDGEEEQGRLPVAGCQSEAQGTARRQAGEVAPGGCRAGDAGWRVTGRGGRP